jgi:response regulator NasT
MTRALRIAVADDEPDVRDYFQRILPRMGHLVVATAANGRELVELCREKKPDLIIADIRMPDMDGDVAIRQICSDRPTPFILISAYSKPFSLDGFDSICRAYLTKPIKRDVLEEAIEQVCPASAGDD